MLQLNYMWKVAEEFETPKVTKNVLFSTKIEYCEILLIRYSYLILNKYSI